MFVPKGSLSLRVLSFVLLLSAGSQFGFSENESKPKLLREVFGFVSTQY